MSWWWPFGGGALNNPDEGSQDTGPGVVRTESKIVVTDERAMMISTVFACVRLLVQTGATLPLGFYERTDTGRTQINEDADIVRLLKYKPNNFMTAKEFRYALWSQRVLWGNGYAKIRRIGARVVSLTPLKPENMTVIRESDGLVYHYLTSKGVIKYQQSDIFHLKGFSLDGIVGLSALGYARHTLGLSVSNDQNAANSSNGNVRAVLETDEFPTDEQKSSLRNMYGNEGTTEFSDGLMITPGGLKYRQISMPPDDLQLLESRQFQVPEICRFFGVPAVMVDGAAGAAAAWPASYEQQVLSFLTFTLKPYLEEWEDKIPASLLNGADQRSVIVEHNVEGLLRADSQGRANFYSSMVQNGLLTRNEIRVKENLPEVTGADDLTVQLNLTPLQDLPKAVEGSNNVS